MGAPVSAVKTTLLWVGLWGQNLVASPMRAGMGQMDVDHPSRYWSFPLSVMPAHGHYPCAGVLDPGARSQAGSRG
eukprot:6754285-Pyramimonas_sp.AAC.1